MSSCHVNYKWIYFRFKNSECNQCGIYSLISFLLKNHLIDSSVVPEQDQPTLLIISYATILKIINTKSNLNLEI